MIRERREIVIVGGGPAGAVAALLLARARHDVLLLERAAVPRRKACGDCLSAQATRVLARLGVLHAIEALRPARLEGWRIVSGNGAEFTARFADVAAGDPAVAAALALARDRLDAALLACAAAAGAEIRTAEHVLGLSGESGGVMVRTRAGEERSIGARLVIGADGLRSVVARSIGAVRGPGRLRKLSLTAHVNGIDCTRTFGEMHVAAGACMGVAPVQAEGGACNLTLVVSGGAEALRATPGRDRAARLSAFVDARRSRFPALRDRLPDFTARPVEWLASGPFDMPAQTVVADGVALVGDAAGYYDPFTGQGIHQALVGGEQLAQHAHAALARPGTVSRDRLASYAAAHARLTAGPRRVQRLIETVLARAAVGNAAIRLLARSASLRNALLAVTGDLLPPRALLDPRYLTACVHALVRPT